MSATDTLAGAVTAAMLDILKAQPAVIVEAIAADPQALSMLREALGLDRAPGDVLSYTTTSLAAVTGIRPRVIADAIRRGDLPARRRGSASRARYVIAAKDGHEWALGRLEYRRRPSSPRAPQSRPGGADRPLEAAFEELFSKPS